MSIGRLPAPSSAIVVPRTFAPGSSEATGNFTSGVQRYAAMRFASPLSVYGTNAYTGERVSRRPWLPWKISTLVPRSAVENGYATVQSFDDCFYLATLISLCGLLPALWLKRGKKAAGGHGAGAAILD